MVGPDAEKRPCHWSVTLWRKEKKVQCRDLHWAVILFKQITRLPKPAPSVGHCKVDWRGLPSTRTKSLKLAASIKPFCVRPFHCLPIYTDGPRDLLLFGFQTTPPSHSLRLWIGDAIIANLGAPTTVTSKTPPHNTCTKCLHTCLTLLKTWDKYCCVQMHFIFIFPPKKYIYPIYTKVYF